VIGEDTFSAVFASRSLFRQGIKVYIGYCVLCGLAVDASTALEIGSICVITVYLDPAILSVVIPGFLAKIVDLSVLVTERSLLREYGVCNNQ